MNLAAKYVGSVVLTLGLLFAVTAFLIGRLETNMIRQFDTTARGLINAMTQEQINELRETQRFKIAQLTKMMAATSSQPFANYDFGTIKHCAELAVKDGDISFVDFHTQEGQSVAKAGKVDGHPTDRIIYQEILDGDQKLGEVRVGYNLERVERQQTEIMARGAEELRRLDKQTQRDLKRLRLALAAMMGTTILVTGLLVWWLFRKLVLRHLRLAVTRAGDIAQGVLDRRDETAYPRDEMGQLLAAMHSMTERLRAVVGEVRQAADTIGDVAGDIARGNADINQRTTEQTTTLRDTAVGIEHLTDTVRRNADCARQAEQLAADARTQAEQGGAVVRQTIAAMTGMNTSSRKIADIIGVVNDIAFQTNLLALNAAVEAARAGEQGRGFAVVAGEVRKLAQRSAESAQEIKALITDSVSKVEEGDRLVNRSGQTLEAIEVAVRKVSDIVAEMAAASREQASGIEQVNQAIVRLDQVAQRNAALTSEAAAASDSLDRETANLLEQMAFFQLAAARRQTSAASLRTIKVDRTGGSKSMKKMMRWSVLGGLVVALGFGVGKVAVGAEGIKVGGGAAPIENIFKKIEDPFEKATGIQLTLTSEGPDQAFINVEKGAIDVAAGGLSFEAWLDLMKQKSHEVANPKDYKYRVIGRDKIQVLAHKDLAAVKSLSKEQLKGIFTGQTANWKEVGGPDLGIVVVFPTKMTGTNKLWQEKVMDGGEWAKANRQEVGEAADLKKKIAETPGAVGAGPLAAQDKGSLHSPETPEVGRPVTALTKGAPSANVQKLFDFIAGDGQKYIVR